MLRKTVALVMTFMLCFSISVNAMTLNVPKEEYYNDLSYENATLFTENADFMYKLASLGILENIGPDIGITEDLTVNILKKALNFNDFDDEMELTLNQQLVKVLCDVLNLEPSENIDVIRTHPDYGLVSSEYLPYYEVYAKNGYIGDKKAFLKPDKPITFYSLFKTLSGLENYIYSVNGAKVISGEVKRINYVNNTKTLTVQTDDYDVDIPLKKGRKTAYLKDGSISYSPDVRIGENVNLTINADNEIVLIENSVNEIDDIPNVEGIYKAKIYLYDYIYGKIIFNELQKFNGEEFIEIPGKYNVFKVSDNALLYEYYRKTNGYYLNRDFLDINAYFIVDTNLKGENEIIYLNVVN